nr:transposase [Streptomyces sp. ISL-96]
MPAEGVHRRHADPPRRDHARALHRLRGRAEAVQRRTRLCPLLVHYPPKVQLSRLVNSLKGVSSRRLRQEYDSHVRRLCGAAASGPAPTSPDPAAAHP